MLKTLDLEKHISITSTNNIENIIKPIRDIFGVKFFRYLKLYKNGKRVVLSNIPDAIRYMYGQGQYVHLWYDGEFPTFLKPGWYNWCLNSLIDARELQEQIENDLISLLGVYHGTTFVQECDHYYEIFSFDTAGAEIYAINRSLLLRFIFYFKEQAKKIIEAGEIDCFLFPLLNNVQQEPEAIQRFLNDTQINRYYISGKEDSAYLTAKEAVCLRWSIEGKTAKEIARLENMQVKTVQRHMENIKLKFNCSKQTQLIQLLLKNEFLGMHW